MSGTFLKLIYEGQKYDVLSINELADEFVSSEETGNGAMNNKPKLRDKSVSEKQMTRLIKAIGDVGKIWNKEKFRKPDISKCKKIWEFKPSDQLRYFCVFDQGEIVIFDKRTKKCRSLPQAEYNSICQKAKTMRLES